MIYSVVADHIAYSASASGTKFAVVNDVGTYLIYSLSGSITLTAASSGTIVAGAKFNGVLRLVKLNAAAHEALLDAHSTVYPTAVATDYDFAGDVGTLRFTWTTQGTASNLLMLTWPHHRFVSLHHPRPKPPAYPCPDL